MNIRFGKYLFILTIILITRQVSSMPIWPIRPNQDPNGHYNRVNCTFGEIHGTNAPHFHQGIDIDCTTGVHPTPIENGVVILNQGENIEIGHGTPVNNEYPRKTIIHEFSPNPNLHAGDPVAAGVTELGTIIASYGHLHFEMWYRDGNVLYPINPLQNDVGWELPYYQYVTDTYDPQVNDVIVEPITQPPQPNGVASGFQVLTTVGGLSDMINGVQRNGFMKAHLTNTIPPVNYSTGSIFDYPNDQLALFGNIGTITNVRDAGINSAPGAAANTSSGEGITVQRLNFCIDTAFCPEQQSKYAIYFDRLNEGEKDDVSQMFHTAFNNANTNDQLTGNNDFIELRSTDATYLYPHKLINGIRSNGIWFTKAREGTPTVFPETPDATHEAKINAEAQYPDGEHTLTFHTEDAAGRIDRAPNGREDNAKVKVIVDNFRPYVQDVKISSGAFPIYSSAWNWETATRELELRPNAVDEKADMGQPLHIAVTTSEPMKLTTDATGTPDGSMKIKLFARDPDDPNRIKVYLDWYDPATPEQNTASRPQSVSENGTTWNFFVPHAQYANLTGGFENYTQFVHITGTDLAGTELLEYDGSQTTFDADNHEIPYRDPNDPQSWVNPEPGFGNISGVDSVHRFLFGGGAAGFAATYGGTGSDETQALEPTFQCLDGVCEHNGYIMAGHSDSFGNGTDIWIVILSLSGDILEEWRFGGSGTEEAYAVQPSYAYVDVGGVIQKQNNGYIVAGSTDSSGNGETDVLVIKLDDNFGVTWANTYGDTGTERAYAIVPTAEADGYLVAGQTTSFQAGSEDGLVMKLHNDGSLDWAKYYGRNQSSQVEGFYAVDQTATGEFLLAGKSRNGKYGFWVVKMDGTGSLQNGGWAREFQDTGTTQNIAYAIDATSDGGAIVVGESTNKLALLKLKSDGTLGWNNKAKTYGTGAFSPIDEGYAVQETSDGGYIVAGLTASAGAGGVDAWLLKLYSTGIDDWQKTYGGLGTDEFYSIRALEDGGYIAAGRTTSFGVGGGDLFVVKTNQDGVVSGTSCAGETLVDVASDSLTLNPATFPDGSMISTMAAQSFPTMTSQTTQGTMTSICGTLPCLHVKQDLTPIPDGEAYNFAPTPAGLSTDARITLENLGTSSLILNSGAITVVGSLEFTLVEETPLPVTLEPGESMNVTITFTPDPQTTTEQTAGVYMTSNDPHSPYVLNVLGNQRHDLTVERTEGGEVWVCDMNMICPDAQEVQQYGEGTTVTLMAIPDQDFVLTGWTVENQPMGLGRLPLAMMAPVDVHATFTRKKYIIAGRVADENGAALADVTMNVSNAPGTTTDANGFYSLVVDSGWTGTVTPELDGYLITVADDPNLQNVTIRPYNEPVREDQLAHNYEGNIEAAIDGQVLLAGGTGLADVLLDGFPGLVLTAADGTYTASVPSGWSGTVIPEKTGYTFAPATFVYTNVTTDLSGQDAVGSSTATYPVSGSVQTSSGEGIPGVIFTGFPDTTVSSSEGVYHTEVNAGWSGTVTPQKEGYTLTPSTVPYSAVTGPLTQDYTGIRHYSLTVSPEGTGLGTVTSSPAGIACGTDCTEIYAENTPITLSAIPDTGSTFTGWSGGGCSGTGTCLVTLTEETTVSAVFTEDIPQHTLTVVTDGKGNGIVASNPDGILCGEECTEPFDDGTPVTLGAMPQPGSTFTGWSGGGCSGTDPCDLTMTADTIVTATFTPVHTLIVEKAGAGTGTVMADGINCGAICENSYEERTGLVLKAIPDAGSTFTGWEVNGVPSGCVVVINGPTTVTATFE